MNRIGKFTAALAVAAMSLTTLAATAAAESKTVAVTVTKSISVGGTLLAPGDYKLVVDRNGDAADVRVLSHNKEVARAKGQFKEMKRFNFGTAITRDDANNLVGVESAKLKGAVVLETAAGTAAANTATN